MSDRIDISIRSQYDASGAKAAAKDMESIAKAQPRGGGDAAAASAAKAEKAILAQASAQARLQSVTGDLAGAQTTLGNAIGKVTPNSIGAIRAQTQLAQVQNKVAAEASRAAGGISGYAQQVGGALTSSLMGVVGPAAAAATAIAAIGKGVELAQLGAQADLVEQRFMGVAAAAGQSGVAIMAMLRSASGGEISDMSLQLAANKASMLGVAQTAEQLGVLMEIARDRAQTMGISTEFAFDSIVTGLGRGSALILDNIGITVEAAEVNEAYAASLGKTADQLTETEKKQALINAVVAQGRATLDATGGAVDSNAAAFARLGAAAENAKSQIGSFLAEGAAPTADSLADLLGALEGTRDGFAGAAGGLQELLIQFGAYSPAMAAATASNQEFADSSQNFASGLLGLLGIGSEATAVTEAHTAATNENTAAISYQSPAMLDAAVAHQESANATAMHTAAILDDRQENILAAEAAGMLSQATRDAAAEHLIAGQQAELQSAKTELLRLQTQAAVDEFLRLNPTLSASGVAAAGAAAGLSPLQIQLAQTAIQANNAQSALAAFQRQAALGAGISGLTPLRGLKERGPVGGALGQGAGSSEAGQRFRTQALINAAFPTVAASPRGGGGGGGGGGAASLGSKLDNAHIQEMQKTEDATRAHYERLAEIEKDYAEKSAEVARRNDVEKRQSRASFYNDLTKATKDIGGEAANQLSAEYEAAFAKSQEFAAKGQHQLAKEYLKTRQEQLGAELDYQQDLARARQDGNQDEVQRLEAIHRLQQDAQRAELSLVEQGGDSIQQARQQALDAEATKYEESLGKIANTADRKEAQIVKSFDAQAQAAEAWATAIERAAGKADAALSKVKGPGTATPGSGGMGSGDDGTGEGGGASVQGLARGGRAASRGSSRSAVGGGSAVATLSEAHAILDMILQLGGIAKKYIKPIELYKQTLGTAIELLTAAADFHTAAQQAAASPISPALVQQLVDEARWVLDLTRHALVPTSERQVEIFERYASTVQSSIGVLSDMADLRQAVSEALRNSQPFDPIAVMWLARRAQEFTALVMAQLIPITEKQAEGVARYAGAVGASVEIISGLATLRQTVTEAMKNSAPFDSQQIAFLVGRAKEFQGMVERQLVPTTEATAAGFDAYATSVGASVSIIGGIATLRQQVTEAMANSQPFDSKQIGFLVARAREFTELVRTQLVPTTEQQSEEVARYAEAVTASAAALKAPLELSGNLFADYVSPSDAQLDMVANDARRFVDRLAAAAKTYSKEGLEASKAYAEGIGATFTAAKDGLLFFDALRSGDFTPQPAALAQFEAGTMALMDTAARLGARAATIPAGDIAALQGVTAALNAQAEMLINMSAVPFGNLGAMAGGYSGSSSTTTTTNYFSNTFVLPNGTTQQMANEVMNIVRRQMESRR